MDLNLPFGSAAWQRQYRSERGPIPLSVKKRRAEKVAQARARFGKQVLRELLLNLAIRVGLPIDAVKKIRNEFLSWVYERQTLIGNRRLTYDPWVGIRPYWIYKAWSGTHRMVNHNRVTYAGDLFMRQPDGGWPSWIELAQALTGP